MASAKTTAAKKRPAPARSPTKPGAAGRQAPARKTAKPAKDAPAPAKVPKSPKPQRAALVRDGFTMPKADFALIATLKTRALSARREAKKSELLRAGLHALAELDEPSLVQALNRLTPVKTGRPRKA